MSRIMEEGDWRSMWIFWAEVKKEKLLYHRLYCHLQLIEMEIILFRIDGLIGNERKEWIFVFRLNWILPMTEIRNQYSLDNDLLDYEGSESNHTGDLSIEVGDILEDSMDTRNPGIDTRTPGMDTRTTVMDTRTTGMDTRTPGMDTRTPAFEDNGTVLATPKANMDMQMFSCHNGSINKC